MKKTNKTHRITAVLLLIACLSIPLTSFAHQAWCTVLTGRYNLNNSITTIFGDWEDLPVHNKVYLNASQHTCEYKRVQKCVICGDIVNSQTKSYTENHNFSKMVYKGYYPSSHLEVYEGTCACGHKKTIYKTARDHSPY